MAYTPGPWHFNGRRITTGAFIVADIWNADEPVGQANARLIAAAPELLSLLKRLWAWDDYIPLATEMRVVIAKAEGRQP